MSIEKLMDTIKAGDLEAALPLCDALAEQGLSGKGILVAIAEGDHDDRLDAIVKVIRLRKELLAAQMVQQLKPGDRVTVLDNIRPRYLRGVTGIVRTAGQDRIQVDLDAPRGRFFRNVGFQPTTVKRS